MSIKGKKVFVGMSGGVDSSAAALILLEQGYDVEGVTMLLRPDSSPDDQSVTDARAVAEALSIPLRVCDYRNVFYGEVIRPFAGAYMNGRTPNPCVVCNRRIKFGLMLDYALGSGADYVATGHYAVTEYCADTGKYLLKKSPSKKDQSYFLCALDQQKLARALFPLWMMDKEEVRLKAEWAGLRVAKKNDSQEICFIPGNDYAKYITDNFGCRALPGDFIDTDGRVIGRHKGIIHYTVGQRKGLGTAFGRPVYVKSIDPGTNTVTLCGGEERHVKELLVSGMNWISGEAPRGSFYAAVKSRSTATPAMATVEPGDGGVRIEFDEPQIPASPGQYAAIYDGDILLGGGVIRSRSY